MDEVLADFPLTANISSLRSAARAADRLDRFRNSRDAQSAVDLIRTLVTLDGSPNGLSRLKTEASNTLEQDLDRANATLVLSLSNLDQDALPERRVPSRAVSTWVRENAPALRSDEATRMLSRLRPEQSSSWWRGAVSEGLAKGFALPDRAWADAALRWLIFLGFDDVTSVVIPATFEVEQALLVRAREAVLGFEDRHRLLRYTSERRWSRLHAWLLSGLFPPGEALQRQQSWVSDATPGLELLVEELPGLDVVAAAVSGDDATFTKLVAQRTRADAALLDTLDPAAPGWRMLWEFHVNAGGAPWPPGADRTRLGLALLDATIDGAECSELVHRLAEDLAQVAWIHPRRAELWPGLEATTRDGLLGRVAAEVVRSLNRGDAVTEPEPMLAHTVANLARRGAPSVYLVVALLEWNVILDEMDFIGWLRSRQGHEWSPVAGRVGGGVLRRRWTRAAEELYRRSRWTTELRPAVIAAQDLLSWWQRWTLSSRGGGTSAVRAPLVRRIADLGAELAPERLNHLWERAGGQRSRLPNWGSPDDRWREAVQLAERGALEGGVGALIDELFADFPHNDGLKELKALLNRDDR